MDNQHSPYRTANTGYQTAYAAAGLASPKQGFIVQHWRGELSPWRTALVVFLVGVFPVSMAAGLLARHISDGLAQGQDEAIPAFVVMPLLGLIFIWAGVGLMRCCWRTLRRPMTLVSFGAVKTMSFGDSSRKALAGVFLLVSIGLILEGPMIAILTIVDVLNPPPVHHHQPPPRIRH